MEFFSREAGQYEKLQYKRLTKGKKIEKECYKATLEGLGRG